MIFHGTRLSRSFSFLGAIVAANFSLAFGGEQAGSSSLKLAEALKAELSREFPGAKIDLLGPPRWLGGGVVESIASLSVDAHQGKGQARIFAQTEEGARVEGVAAFVARTRCYSVTRRISPAEKLSSENLKLKEVDLASGSTHEMRGLILTEDTHVDRLEARQTFLSGQCLTSNGVQRIPDVRRGDTVKIRLISSGLSVVTLGIAEEPAYVNGALRVMASKTKRQLLGKLLPDGLVEVGL